MFSCDVFVIFGSCGFSLLLCGGDGVCGSHKDRDFMIARLTHCCDEKKIDSLLKCNALQRVLITFFPVRLCFQTDSYSGI